MSEVTKVRDYWDGEHSRGEGACSTTWCNNFIDPDVGKDKRVLNVGSGDCTFVPPVAGCKKLVNLDISMVALLRASENKRENEEYVLADAAARLPFRDGSFDLAFSIDTLTLLGDRCIYALREMARVAKSLVFVVGHIDLSEKIRPGGGSKSEFCTVFQDNGLGKAFFSEEEVGAFIAQEGLRMTQIFSITDYELQYAGAPIYQMGPKNELSDVRAAIVAYVEHADSA